MLIKTIKEGCPNLIRIHIPHLEKIQHDIAILNQYNQSLKDSILTYNEKLASHPYYIVYNVVIYFNVLLRLSNLRY